MTLFLSHSYNEILWGSVLKEESFPLDIASWVVSGLWVPGLWSPWKREFYKLLQEMFTVSFLTCHRNWCWFFYVENFCQIILLCIWLASNLQQFFYLSPPWAKITGLYLHMQKNITFVNANPVDLYIDWMKSSCIGLNQQDWLVDV